MGLDSADQKHSEDSSPIADSDKNFSRALQGPNTSTAETGLRGSSIEGNTQHSPEPKAPGPPTLLRETSGE